MAITIPSVLANVCASISAEVDFNALNKATKTRMLKMARTGLVSGRSAAAKLALALLNGHSQPHIHTAGYISWHNPTPEMHNGLKAAAVHDRMTNPAILDPTKNKYPAQYVTLLYKEIEQEEVPSNVYRAAYLTNDTKKMIMNIKLVMSAEYLQVLDRIKDCITPSMTIKIK